MLAPLCGTAADVRVLNEGRDRVRGMEFNDIAVRGFCDDNAPGYAVRHLGGVSGIDGQRGFGNAG